MLCARCPAVVVKPLPNSPAQRLVPDARGRQERARHRRVHMPHQGGGASVPRDEGVETLALLVPRVLLTPHVERLAAAHHVAVLAEALDRGLELHPGQVVREDGRPDVFPVPVGVVGLKGATAGRSLWRPRERRWRLLWLRKRVVRVPLCLVRP